MLIVYPLINDLPSPVWVNGTPSQMLYLVGPSVISWLHDYQINDVFFLSFIYIFIYPSLFLFLLLVQCFLS